MGRSVNKVTLIGTLGRDPEVRFMPNGNAVANLSLATDESYNDKQTGQKVEQTEWHRITAYGKLAEIMQQYLKKGSKTYIEGKLRTREWEKDGVKRYTTEIIANDMLMLDGRPQDGMQGSPMGYSNAPQQAPQQAPYGQSYQQPMQAPQQPMQAPQQPMQAAPMHNPNSGYQAPAHNPAAHSQRPPHQSAPQQAPQQAPMAAPAGYQAPQPAPQPQQAPPSSNNFDDFDDDIPF